MPMSGFRRPPAPTCEDCCDEDAQDSLSDNRASANVAVKRSKSSEFDSKSSAGRKNHDGSDSGYSSKAGTSDSMSTASKTKGVDLKINTNPTEIERERRQYSFAPSPPEGRRSPTKTKGTKADKNANQIPRFRHSQGQCWVCDQYGYHFDIDKDIQRPATVAPTQIKKDVKAPAPKARAKEESDGRPQSSRRSSSTKREARPVSMYAAPGAFTFPPQPVDYSHPMLASHGWEAAHQQVPQYPHYTYPYPLHTPVSATYAQPAFFEMSPMQYSQPPEQGYGIPPFGGYLEPPNPYKSSSHDGDSQRSPSRDTRPRSATQKSKILIEADRIPLDRMTADRISMPPPPRPDQVRPVIRKSSTEYPSVSGRTRSVFEEEDMRAESQNIIARERRSSQSRPPSSYKAVPSAVETYGRPSPRKSSSYSTSSGTVHIASSPSERDMPRRKTSPLEQRVSDVENYVARTNRQKESEMEAYLGQIKKQREIEFHEYYSKDKKGAINPSLTAEALRRFEQKHSSAMSDTGSAKSKHSSSRGSGVGRVRAGTTMSSLPQATTITMDNGFSLSIPAEYGGLPLDIMVGNLRLSNITPIRDDMPEQKAIERAPSEASHTSRRSMTSGSAISLPKARDDYSSSGRPKQSANSSKRSSRAASSNRPDKDIRSIDYSLLDESYYREY